MKKLINIGKRSRTPSEVKTVENIEPECQESLIQRKIHIQQNSNEGLEYW